jgi:hypothetical protein
MKHADEVADEDIVFGRVRGVGETASQEPSPRPTWHAGRGGVAVVDPQAHPQLEL